MNTNFIKTKRGMLKVAEMVRLSAFWQNLWTIDMYRDYMCTGQSRNEMFERHVPSNVHFSFKGHMLHFVAVCERDWLVSWKGSRNECLRNKWCETSERSVPLSPSEREENDLQFKSTKSYIWWQSNYSSAIGFHCYSFAFSFLFRRLSSWRLCVSLQFCTWSTAQLQPWSSWWPCSCCCGTCSNSTRCWPSSVGLSLWVIQDEFDWKCMKCSFACFWALFFFVSTGCFQLCVCSALLYRPQPDGVGVIQGHWSAARRGKSYFDCNRLAATPTNVIVHVASHEKGNISNDGKTKQNQSF